MKRTALFSILTAFVLTFLLSGCGAKRDEALVTEFNAKKTEAEALITTATDGAKKMKDDHVAWAAKMADGMKMPKCDTAMCKACMAQMADHEKMWAGAMAEIDSLKSYAGAKTDNNDQLKSAIAGLNSHIAMLTAQWKTITEAHAKLGADMMAMMAPAGAPAKEEAKKSEAKAAPAAKPAKDDNKPHEVKNQTPGGEPVKTSRPGGVKK